MTEKTVKPSKIKQNFLDVAKTASDTGAIGIIIVGVFPLVHWLVNFHLFGASRSEYATMNPVTAISFILCGLVLLILKKDGKLLKTRMILNAAVIAAASLKIMTFASGWNMDLDHLVFMVKSDARAMSPNVAICFLLIGCSLLLKDEKGKRGLRPIVFLNLGVLLISFLAIVGRIYNILSLYQISNNPPMPLATAWSFIILSFSIICLKPEYEPLTTILSDTVGGVTARRLLPLAGFGPLIMGWIVFDAFRKGYMAMDGAMSVLVLGTTALFMGIIWWTAKHLRFLDDGTKYLMDILEKKAMIDGLTGLWNRGHFDHRLAVEMAIMKRKSRVFSCVIADVDHFKKINDSYGHIFGDEVLRVIGQTLTESCRQEDIVCRYGGEEFVIILPGTDEKGAIDLAERMRSSISKLNFTSDGSSVQVTCSFGVAQARNVNDSVVKLADMALYRAKNGGRNKVEVHVHTEKAA